MMKRMRRLVLILPLVIGVFGCVPSGRTARVEISDEAGPKGAETGGELTCARLWAYNSDEVYLLGAASSRANASRSILLRSTDGGKSWKEVMKPVDLGTMVGMAAWGKRQRWALVSRKTNKDNTLLIYESEDSGKTWRRVGTVLRRANMGRILSFGFIDRKRGKVGILYEGSESQGGFITMATADGGARWNLVRRLSLEEYRAKNPRWDQEATGTVSDAANGKSQWKLERQQRGIVILRRVRESKDWEIRSIVQVVGGAK